jgi:hypothetical protein
LRWARGVKSTSVTFLLSAALVVSAGLMVVAALGGCSAPPPAVRIDPPAQPEPGRALTLALGGPGADDTTMVPFADGQDAELVPGAQGGFHVWMRLAVKDVPSHTILAVERFATRASDGAVVLRFSSTVEVGDLDADGWYRTPSFPMFMCPTPIGISVVDTPIAFELRVSDESGATELGRAGITLVPRCPTADRDLCARICTG